MFHLTFGGRFNQQLDQYSFPDCATHIYFGWWFNQPLNPDINWQNVSHLYFGRHFNQRINKNILANTEINYFYKNKNYTKLQIVNLFSFHDGKKKYKRYIDTEEYFVEDKFIDSIGCEPITKIKLIHKSVMHQKIKSANKI